MIINHDEERSGQVDKTAVCSVRSRAILFTGRFQPTSGKKSSSPTLWRYNYSSYGSPSYTMQYDASID